MHLRSEDVKHVFRSRSVADSKEKMPVYRSRVG